MFKRRIRRSREYRKADYTIDFEKARAERKEKREALAKGQPAVDPEEKGKPAKWRISKKHRRRNFCALILLITAAVVAFSALNVISVNKQLEEAEREKQNLIAEKERLLDELEKVDSEEYIEQQARTMLKMIKPGEIYYVVPDDEE